MRFGSHADVIARSARRQTVAVRARGLPRRLPILMFGGDFWDRVIDWQAMVEAGTIGPNDPALMTRVDSPEAAWEAIDAFYA